MATRQCIAPAFAAHSATLASASPVDVANARACPYLLALARARQQGGRERWFQALVALCRTLGFDDVSFQLQAGQAATSLAHSTIASTWRRRYRVAGYAACDPLVAHCRSHCAPLVWTSAQFAGGTARRLYDDACRIGLRAGVALPIHGPDGARGMLCVATRAQVRPALVARLGEALPSLSLLRDAAQETAQPLLKAESAGVAPRLTARERECTYWVAQGKSTWEISRICRISEATVNFHVGNVRRKFGVSSRTTAVLKAAALGLLAPIDRR